jgi:hypothetical protein
MSRRLLALLLLTVFLGAGTTLPNTDALLFHWVAGSEKLRPHVEPAGGCGSHSEECTLGPSASGDGAAVAHAYTLRVHSTAPAPLGSVVVVPASTADRCGIPQPRAPPAHLG